MPRSDWVKILQDNKYKEAAIGRGLTANSSIMIELYASADGGTWTITFSDTSGRTCGFAAGQDWQVIVPMVGDPS